MAPVPCGHRHVAAIHLGRALLRASCNLPGRRAGNCPESRLSCRPYSVLLPVWFTVPLPLPGTRWALTPPFHPCPPGPEGQGGRSAFCGTVTGVAPAGCYPAPCLHGARTFLTRSLSAPAGAAARPAGSPYKGIRRPKRNNRTQRTSDVGAKSGEMTLHFLAVVA